MVTGYEAKMYSDISVIARSLEGIEKHLGVIAEALSTTESA